MQNGSISDLNNLKFYTDNGIEIYTEKQYTIAWEFKENNPKFRVLPKGFILADIMPASDNPDEDIYIINPDTIQIGFTDYPEIYLDKTMPINPDTGASDAWPYNMLEALWYNYYVNIRNHNQVTKNHNIIVITINLSTDKFIKFELPANKFFGVNFEYLIKDLVIGDMDNLYDDINEFQKYGVITNIDLYKEDGYPYMAKILAGCPWTISELQESGKQTASNQSQAFNLINIPDTLDINGIHEIGADNICIKDGYFVPVNPDGYTDDELRYIQCLGSGIAIFFPFIRYLGQIQQEPVSTDFFASNTLIILEEVTEYDENGNPDISYEYPALDASSTNWELIFQVPEAGELRILKTDDDINIKTVLQDSRSLAVSNVELTPGTANPMYLCIGALSSLEGVYQNYLGLYLSNPDTERQYFFGVISVKTEIIGEDERYRTLMENFGIPDPANYHNIFAENDYDEMLCNWDFINKKCKELMLIYPEIFPYAGTYKGLINAIKFLGYDDIIIKEWYNIIDTRGTEKNIAFESIDLINGKLYSLLKNYNVDYNDTYKKYHKLNQISLIYHINELIEKDKIDDQTLWIKDSKGEWTEETYSEYLPFDIPLTLPIYTYRNEEILAKLYSVKKWLETYIIGVNVHITDITAEGIYFIPYQTNLYSNNTQYNDFITEDYVTPKLINVTLFEESKSDITCSLAEFNNITFGEYTDKNFKTFEKRTESVIKKNKVIGVITANGQAINVYPEITDLHISNTIGTPVYSDEFGFELSVKPSSGTLCQYTNSEQDQIIIADNTINFLKHETHTVEFDVLPIIYIEDGNIRHMNGKWENNIAWLIKEIHNNIDWTSAYHIQPLLEPNLGYDCYTHVTLIPKLNATLKYSADNKWQVPMFIFSNYKFAFYNENIKDAVLYDIPENIPFIVEIINGRLSFYNKTDDVSTEVLIFNDLNDGERSADIRYTYRTPVQSILTGDYQSKIKEILANLIVSEINISDDDYNKKITEILNLKNKIAEFNQPFLKEESKMFNPHPNKYIPFGAYNIEANEGMVNYYDIDPDDLYITDDNNNPLTGEYWDQTVINYWFEHLCNIEKAKIEDQWLETLESIYNVLNNNIEITLSVNHIGNYDIVAKVYDRYNSIYISKGVQSAKVLQPKPTFDIIANQEYANNSLSFCKTSVQGELLNIDKITEFKNEQDSADIIKYTLKWPVYKIDYNYENPDQVSWWNYSYAVESPAAGDYLWFRNTRYKVGYIANERLYLYDSTDITRLFKQYSNNLYAVVYNKKTLEIVSITENTPTGRIDLVCEHYKTSLLKDSINRHYMTGYNIKIPDYIKHDIPEFNKFEYCIGLTADSYNSLKDYINDINSGIYELYIIPAMSYTFAGKNNISQYFENDYDTNHGSIAIPDKLYPLFSLGDVIKISYDISIYDKFNIVLDINNSETDNNEWLLQASYMSVKPCLYIKYTKESGKQHFEFAINNVNDFVQISQDAFEDVEYILFFKQYIDDNRFYCFLLNSDYTLSSNEIDNLYNFKYTDAVNNIISKGNSAFIKAITSTVKFFDDNKAQLIFPYTQGELIKRLHNEASNRIIGVQKNNHSSAEKLNYVTYTYQLADLIDKYLIEEYECNHLYDLQITLSYPYKNFVQYIAPVKKNSDIQLLKYGANDYTLLRTNSYIDIDRMFLDSYLDSNFQAVSYEYNPQYIKDTFITEESNIFLDEKTESYLYHNTSVTVNAGLMLWFKPCIKSDHTFIPGEEPKNFLESIEEIEWAVYNNMYDADEIMDYQESITSNECLYRIRNNSFVIKPNTVGSHTVRMTIWDKYGNKLVNNYSGSFYVKEISKRSV